MCVDIGRSFALREWAEFYPLFDIFFFPHEAVMLRVRGTEYSKYLELSDKSLKYTMII